MALIVNTVPLAACCRPGHLTLVTDHATSPAAFITHQLLTTALKEPDVQCILVSFGQPFEYWKTVQARAGITLASPPRNASFAFVDAFSQLSQPPTSTSKGPQRHCVIPPVDAAISFPFRVLFNSVLSALRATDSGRPRLLLMDDVSILDWLGAPVKEICLFWRGLLALRHKTNLSIVVRQAVDASDEDIAKLLLSSCNVNIEVSPLSSGRSSAVTGEIMVQRGPLACAEDAPHTATGTYGLQYRLTDTGAVWIDMGTGGGML